MPIEGVDTREDQIDALRVLSAGNTLIMVLLGGILALQVCFSNLGFLFQIFFFLCFINLVTRAHTGRAGMGSEIGVEGTGENCGRGSESKRRRKEGTVRWIERRSTEARQSKLNPFT